ncbi:MAG: reverse transcriptase family protein, partial [Bacteroidales bacterium]|nr:reverse transcriptase family protein [Bacteroidales bacterium]
ENDKHVQNYVETLKINGFNILNDYDVNSFTYSENKNGNSHVSILDHIFTDKFDKSSDFKIEIQNVCFSDHRALLFECDLNIERNNKSKGVTLYNFEEINYKLNNIDINAIDFEEFMKVFSELIKNHSQTKIYKNNLVEKKPWIDRELKIELKKRKELYNLKKNNPHNLALKTEFNRQKNKVGAKIIQNRKEFFDNKFRNSVNDPKKFWSNINSLLYNKNSEKRETFELKNVSGQILNEKQTADTFNEHFITLPLKTINGEYGDIDTIETKLTSNYSIINSMFLSDVDEEEIYEVTMKLKNSFSTGIDNINTRIIKECAVGLSKILPNFINKSFETGVFPDCLKIAKVIPIFKKSGSKNDPVNFRPISLLNIISKIQESCMYNRLYSYLDSIKFFNSKQFGFLKSSNTTSACISYIDKIQRALNENKLVGTLFLDVAKAFDCVDRNILIEKLQQLGIRNNVLKLFESYITNRKQAVQIHDTLSELKETQFGVAQGSKLGPLLFLIYINDIFKIKLNGSLQLYADDSSITFIADNAVEMHKMIMEDIIKISDWFKNNLLVLNGDKSKLLFFNSTRLEFQNLPDIYINSSKISTVDEIKYLGLIVDSKLNWNAHINSLVKKLSPYVGVFKKISFVCGTEVKKMLYYAYFYSNIIYLLTIWSGTKKENINRIKILQNKCIRNLFFNQYKVGNITTNDLYKSNSILEFEKVVDLEMNVNFYKILNKKLKCDVSFEPNSNLHNHKTRQSSKLHKIKNKNKYGILSFTNRAISTYNVLSSPIKKIKNHILFKKKMKTILFDKQVCELSSKKQNKIKNKIKFKKK